ncbi:SDR family NAD(P)-dependent oxidoreductase [Umezawaea sp. NPDC059074]|uniref:SDR family NAD(P)-dependent oxidoreductase n=1 Tax=Umezawaea sp. NPDC059074 TaxID=3346716 RepID=UPI0036855E2D
MPKTIVITGSSDGIGAAAARQLAGRGHTVVVVGRSPDKTAAVAREIGGDHFVADFARFADVRALAAALGAKYPRIDVLANNAGGVFGDPGKTVDGFEKTVQVNHLSPFLLTNLLMDTLLAARASVIQTSSAGARMVRSLDVDDLDNDRNFSAGKAYSASKLENILFTRELHTRYHDRGLSAAAFHPGGVATNFADDSTAWLRPLYRNPVISRLLTSADKAARQLVWLAEGQPGVDWQSGQYYEKYRPRKTRPLPDQDHVTRRLWDRSAEVTGLGG